MGRRDDLIRQIYENGNYAIKKICEMNPDDKMANFSATDCIIGTANTHLALKIAKEKGYPQDVIEYLENQSKQEQWHCKLHIGKPPKPYDFIVAQKHREILLKYGIYVWMGVMQLLGEKTALAKAICWRRDDDPHFVNKFATVDEYYHTTYPLLLLYKYASEEELEKIVELQKEYITNIFKLK